MDTGWLQESSKKTLKGEVEGTFNNNQYRNKKGKLLLRRNAASNTRETDACRLLKRFTSGPIKEEGADVSRQYI